MVYRHNYRYVFWKFFYVSVYISSKSGIYITKLPNFRKGVELLPPQYHGARRSMVWIGLIITYCHNVKTQPDLIWRALWWQKPIQKIPKSNINFPPSRSSHCHQTALQCLEDLYPIHPLPLPLYPTHVFPHYHFFYLNFISGRTFIEFKQGGP